MKALYVSACRRWGPRKMTVSAWAWVYAQETGTVWPRYKIDGIWMILFNSPNHCQSCWQRHFRISSCD